jgi:tetratricopeptide (TPR) repeat protein
MADKTLIMKEAQKFLSRGQIDKAISEWEKLIQESPDGNTFNIVGDLYFKKGDKKSAIESFHQAAKFFRDEGFSLKALALYKKLLNINPSDPEALFALGQLNEEKGLSTDAIKYYLAAADSLSKEGQKDRLLEIYEKILSLSPSNIPLRSKVAEIFLKEGLVSDASKEYIFIAGIHAEKEDTQKAEEYYRKAREIQPSSREALLGLVRLYERSDRPEKAIETIREACALLPGDTGILFRHAEILASRGDAGSAEERLREILDKEPAHIGAGRLLGDIYLQSGDKEKAWKEYLPMIDAMILEEKYRESVGLLESHREFDPLEAGKRLVSLRRKLGEDDLAAEELVLLGDALRDREMNEEAVGCYKDALEIKPDDDAVKEKINALTREPEPEPSAVHEEEEETIVPMGAAEEGGKSTEERLIEADIFLRYGLNNEALRLLEGLKVRDPRNIEVHTRLKSLYASISDKESAVTECLVLSELYKRMGNNEIAEEVLKEALSILPEDPRLAERGLTAEVPEEPSLEPTEIIPEEPSIEDYEEEISEADFYTGQGLYKEAHEILERLNGLFPENEEIARRIETLNRAESTLQEGPAERTGEYPEPPELSEEKTFVEKDLAPSGADKPEQEEYEDFTLTDQDLVDAEEIPEPVLDNDVLDIFQEFKRGLEKELGEEDSETHYNLGIAYKEMGLIDDAIKEFQTSRDDPKRFLQSSTMLGVCYIEKGVFSLAIEALSKALERIDAGDESHWAVKYDLAEAYEKDNKPQEALGLYTEVFGWNAGFRNVSDRVSRLKTRLAKGAEGQEKPKERKNRVSYL